MKSFINESSTCRYKIHPVHTGSHDVLFFYDVRVEGRPQKYRKPGTPSPQSTLYVILCTDVIDILAFRAHFEANASITES